MGIRGTVRVKARVWKCETDRLRERDNANGECEEGEREREG